MLLTVVAKVLYMPPVCHENREGIYSSCLHRLLSSSTLECSVVSTVYQILALNVIASGVRLFFRLPSLV